MSICKGLDKIIDQHLGLAPASAGNPRYYSVSAAKNLSQQFLPGFKADALLEDMLLCLQGNWSHSTNPARNNRSEQNWRWAKQSFIHPNNKSSEKILEKAIVNATSCDWVNQVPTASGLYSSHNDRHRNIDLVHRIQRGIEYEFIELKVGSNTPLMAAMEVLTYAALYVLFRLNCPQQSDEILQAKIIHLQVLAPQAFYEPYQLDWLEKTINSQLNSFVARHLPSLCMDFQFQQFPIGSIYSNVANRCLNTVQRIHPVTW